MKDSIIKKHLRVLFYYLQNTTLSVNHAAIADLCRHFAATIETSAPAKQRKQLILNAFFGVKNPILKSIELFRHVIYLE